MTVTADVGNAGEDAAARWLTAHGFDIAGRNWRRGRYEIDIIAFKSGALHIIEVKCRARGGLTQPGDAYTASKFAVLQKAAEVYIEENGIDADTHFDLVAVTHCNGQFTVEYIPDAMVTGW